MDIHDAHVANADSWIFYGDSITQRGLDHDDIALGGILAAQINASVSTNWPVMENGGIGGYTAADAAAKISTWLEVTPAKYIRLLSSTEDAHSRERPGANHTTELNNRHHD